MPFVERFIILCPYVVVHYLRFQCISNTFIHVGEKACKINIVYTAKHFVTINIRTCRFVLLSLSLKASISLQNLTWFSSGTTLLQLVHSTVHTCQCYTPLILVEMVVTLIIADL